MNVQGILLFLVCRSTAADPGLAASSSDGCAPECKGSCFAGNCLFADNEVDDEDAFRSTQRRQATQSTPISFSQAADGLGFPSSRETTGLGFQSEEMDLTDQLQRAEAHESLLRVQNEKLRQQLYEWKLAGTNIAQREAKVMAFLGSQRPATAAALPAAAPSTVGALSGLHPSILLQSARQRLEKTSLGHSLLLIAEVIFVVLALLNAWLFIQRWSNGEVSLQSLSQALVKNTNKSVRCQPVLRAMGLVQYKVEISEIHLGSLFAGSSDIRVNFRMGNGTERRTKVLKNAGGTFLRFDDVLELSICGADPPCTICVTDRRGDLAHVELAAAQMVKLASRPHQEYFRTELTACRELGDLGGRRPYVAMRMRNKVAPLAPAAATVAERCKRPSDQRVYGSFAV